MDPQNQGDAPAKPSIESVIDSIVAKAAQDLAPVAPVVATALAAGAEFEPVISGLIHMFAGLLKHHAKPQPAAS